MGRLELARYLSLLIVDFILAKFLSLNKNNPPINLPCEVEDLNAVQLEQTVKKIFESRKEVKSHLGSSIRLSVTEINSLFYQGYRDFLSYPNNVRVNVCIPIFKIEEDKLIERIVVISKPLLVWKKVKFISQTEVEHKYYVENRQIYDEKRYRIMRGIKLNSKASKFIESIQNSQSLLGKLLLNTERDRVNIRRKFDIDLFLLEDGDVESILIDNQELKITLNILNNEG